MVKQYCATCHSDRGKAGGLTLASFDAAQVAEHADVAEKMIRKLRAGMMPPAGAKRPDEATLLQLASALETRIDRAAALEAESRAQRPFQRLNRAEYARAVRDLLEHRRRRRRAAAARHHQPRLRQHRRRADDVADGARRLPARGRQDQPRRARRSDERRRPRRFIRCRAPRRSCGTSRARRSARAAASSVMHIFPADGEYLFRMMLHSIPTGQLYGSTTRGEQIEVSVNGERKALLDINPRMSESDPKGINVETEPDLRQGRSAARLGGVHRARREPGRRSDRADRLHAGRHADRQRARGHDAAAPARARRSPARTRSPACPTR